LKLIEEKGKKTMPVISGKAYWAFIDTPRTSPLDPDKPRYSVDVGNLDKSNVKLAKDLGLNVKTDDPDSGKANAGQREKYVTLRAYGLDFDGNPKPRIPLVDTKNKQLDERMYRRLGNGSDINVKFHSKTTKSGFVQFHLDAIQVIDLLQYDPPEDDEDRDVTFDVVKDGYKAEVAEDVPF
jgi:hypothetical protein